MESIELFERLLKTSAVAERRELVRDLMRSKRLVGTWSDPRMKLFVQEVARRIDCSTSPSERLGNTVLLGRLFSAIPKARSPIVKAYSTITSAEPAPLSEEYDSDDRLAAATLITHLDKPWVVTYVARQIVVEESAEKTREQLIRALLAKSDLSSAFRAIQQQLETIHFETDTPSESLAKRLRRIIVSMRKALPTVETRCGSNTGAHLRDLLSKPLAAYGVLPAPNIIDGLAEDIVGLIYDIVRTQIELAAEPTMYDVTRVPRGWIGALLWPRFIGRSTSGKKLLGALEGAIVLLGRQGLASQTLRDVIVEMIGSQDGAAARLRKLGELNADLAPNIRTWLQNGGRTVSSHQQVELDEHSLAGTDEYIGALLLAASALKSELEANRASTKDDRSGGGYALTDSRLVACAKTLVDEAWKLARHRGIELVGSIGEEVAYSRYAHELTVGDPASIARVKIVRPLVERVLPSGKKVIVIRAVVESAEISKQ